jgi:assimilatory nitrate reductase catalytic subunit
VFRVCVTDGQRRGDIFVPMHWTDVMAGGARANMLPGQGTDPVSGQPGFKNTPARVVPLAPEWRGFLLRRDGVAPEGLLWWSRSAVKGGWLHELAGEGAVPVEALLPAGERLEVADMCGACAASRCAAMMAAGGRAVHHRNGTLPPREWIAANWARMAPPPNGWPRAPARPHPIAGRSCACALAWAKRTLQAHHDGAAAWRPSARPRARAPLRIVPPRPGANAGTDDGGGGMSDDFPAGMVWLVGAGPATPIC